MVVAVVVGILRAGGLLGVGAWLKGGRVLNYEAAVREPELEDVLGLLICSGGMVIGGISCMISTRLILTDSFSLRREI